MVKVSTAIHHLEVLNDATEEVDAHGEVNILSEQDWSNIKISSTKKNPHPKIEGVSLNCLLKGIFTLYGIEKCHGLDLPGGVFTWEDILEPTFIALTQIAHVEDVVKRVHVLVIFLHFRSGYNHCPSSVADKASEISSQESASSTSGAQPSTQYLASLVYGAFSFLLYWVTCFSAYLTDMDVLCINNGVQRMKGLVVGQPSSSHQPPSSRPSLGGGAEAAASNIETSLRLCGARYSALLAAVGRVVREGMQRSLGLPIGSSLAASGPFSSPSLMSPSMLLLTGGLDPNVPVVEGEWAGHEAAAQREQLKATLAATAPVKLEIFGGDMLLDDECSDDEGGSGGGGEVLGSAAAASALPAPPVPRVPPGSSLLLNPLAVAAGNSLLGAVDATELARQWTLVDHLLFCSIPLNSLLPRVRNSVGAVVHAPRKSKSSSNNNTRGGVGGGGSRASVISSGSGGTAPHATVMEMNYDSASSTNTASGSGATPRAQGISSAASCSGGRGGGGGSGHSVFEQTRHQQLLLGCGQGGGIYSGAKGFVDRFNAMSSWVTFSILKDPHANTRASTIGFFAKVASALLGLSNYNGVMVVLTALQQGSVARLKRTWELVTKADKLKLAQMQKLMSAAKNYQVYRQELQKLAAHFELNNVHSTGNLLGNMLGVGAGAGGGAATSAQGIPELIWKRDIHSQYTQQQEWSGTGAAAGADSLGLPPPLLVTQRHERRASSTYTDESRFEALVPHLGAHLQQLSSALEGNTDHLADQPHLFSMHKLALVAEVLGSLHRMQRLRYNLTPVRLVAAALNRTAQQHLQLGAAEAAAYSKQLYALSELAEPTVTAFTDDGLDASMGAAPSTGAGSSCTGSSIRGTRDKVTFKVDAGAALPSGAEDRGVMRRAATEGRLGASSTSTNAGGERVPTGPLGPTGRPKYRKSDAYERIAAMQRSGSFSNTSAAASTSGGKAKWRRGGGGGSERSRRDEEGEGDDDDEGDEDEGDEGDDDEDDEQQRKKKVMANPMKLVRSITASFRWKK